MKRHFFAITACLLAVFFIPIHTNAQTQKNHNLPALIKRLGVPTERAQALDKITVLGKEAMDDLVRGLTDANPEIRIGCAMALENLGTAAKECVPELMHMLGEDEDPRARVAAARALGVVAVEGDEGAGTGTIYAYGALMNALSGDKKKDADWRVRREAAIALGKIGPDALWGYKFAMQKRKPLLKAAKDPQSEVAEAVAETIKKYEAAHEKNKDKAFVSNVWRPEPVSLPAFPGVEGAGAVSKGGRGGRVIKVTNLNAKGPGSLQWACNQEGPRIVVFEVSGVIHGSIRIRKKGYLHKLDRLTIAGQTAPGAGITVNGFFEVHGPRGNCLDDLIIRFIRIRPNPPRGHSGGNDGAQFYRLGKTVFDHVSVAWGGDETFSVTKTGPVSIQWCTVEESALISEGGVSPHNYGSLLGYDYRTMSMHHTLYAHHSDRFPQITAGAGIIDIRNNVVYNCDGSCAGVNIIGCYLKAGPGGAHPRRSDLGPSVMAESAGVSGTVLGNPRKSYAGGNFHDLRGGYAYLDSERARKGRAEKPHDAPPVKTHSAERARDLVLAHAGCLPRDAVTRRTIEEVRTGTGSWGAAMPEGGLMAGLTPGKAPADSDGDGMPDAWEKAHGLDPNTADNNKIVPAGASPGDRHKGYTYIEYYINDCADRLIAGALEEAAASEKRPAPPRPMRYTPWSAAQPGSQTDTPEVAKMIDIIRKPKNHDVRRWKAARNLCYHHRPASAENAAAVAALLKHEDVKVRRCAAWVIGCMDNPPKEAMAPLAGLTISDDIGKGGSWYTTWALARIGRNSAELALPALQKVKKGRGMIPVGYALNRMGPDANRTVIPFLVTLLNNNYHATAYWTATAIAEIGKEAVPLLAKTLQSGREQGKCYAAMALAFMGPKAAGAAGALVRALDDSAPAVRRRAALALGCLGAETEGVPAGLSKALKDKSWYVRHQAARALAILGPGAKAALPALTAALKDEQTEVRAAAADAIGWTGPDAKTAVAALIDTLQSDKDFWPRLCAARALGRIGDAPDSAAALGRALSDADAEVRAGVARALGRLGPAAKPAAAALRKALEDSDYMTQSLAREALVKIGG